MQIESTKLHTTKNSRMTDTIKPDVQATIYEDADRTVPTTLLSRLRLLVAQRKSITGKRRALSPFRTTDFTVINVCFIDCNCNRQRTMCMCTLLISQKLTWI